VQSLPKYGAVGSHIKGGNRPVLNNIYTYIQPASREESQLMVELDVGRSPLVRLDSFDQLAFIEVLSAMSSTQIATTPDLSPLTSRLFCHSKSMMAYLCGPMSRSLSDLASKSQRMMDAS